MSIQARHERTQHALACGNLLMSVSDDIETKKTQPHREQQAVEVSGQGPIPSAKVSFQNQTGDAIRKIGDAPNEDAASFLVKRPPERVGPCETGLLRQVASKPLQQCDIPILKPALSRLNTDPAMGPAREIRRRRFLPIKDILSQQESNPQDADKAIIRPLSTPSLTGATSLPRPSGSQTLGSARGRQSLAQSPKRDVALGWYEPQSVSGEAHRCHDISREESYVAASEFGHRDDISRIGGKKRKHNED